MSRLRTLAACVVAAISCCCAAHAVTLTFDDVPSGTKLALTDYMADYRVAFDDSFQAVDHTTSLWGPPVSPHNVLLWSGSGSTLELGARVFFGYYTSSYAERDDIRAVRAYFSTQSNVTVKITAYHSIEHGMVPVTTVVIGSAEGLWTNRYVEITSPDTPFDMLLFEGVNSPDELLHFCVDDMTVVPVPEPGSLVALLAGLTGLGGLALRRRRG